MRNCSTVFVIYLIAMFIFLGCGKADRTANSVDEIPPDTLESISDASKISIGIQKFAVYMQGEEVGLMTLEISDHNPDSLSISQTINWNMILMGTLREIEMILTASSDRKYNLGWMEMQMSDGSADFSVRAVRYDSILVTEIGTAGRVIDNSFVIEEDFLPVLTDLACASMDWTEGQERSFQSFDPASGSIHSSTVRCEGFEEIPFLSDTVNATRLELSQMGTLNTIWVYEGQIIKEYEAGLGMQMLRIPIDVENDDLDEPAQLNEEYFASGSDVWYALEIRQVFPDGIELSNWIYPLAEISCLPQDITDFNISVNEGSSFWEGVLEVSGTLSFDPILEPFSVFDGANGKKYMMNLDAFLITPDNEILWSQSGYPRGGNAWVSAEGGYIEFTLIGSNTESLCGNRILVIASGDPIESPDSWETRVIIGVGEQEL